MKLSVAANYDFALIPELARQPVDEVYGKLPDDGLGGGRPRYMASPISRRRLARYVALLNSHGIAFNYLLNASCHANDEWSRAWQSRLSRLLDEIQAMGIERLTVSTPYLLERIKSTHPRFHIKAGIYAQIDTPGRARFWQNLGADALTLESFSINRDFARLRAIRDAVSCDLVLIANHPCLLNCPMQPYHQNLFAHGSLDAGRFFIDYCFLRCSRRRLQDPAELIRSAWIRPEDLHHYERLGYSTFKLLERGMPSQDLLKRVRAYGQRSFSGNLAQLLLPYGFSQNAAREKFWLARNFIRPWRVKPLRLLPFYRILRQQGMLFAASESLGLNIDNQRLGPCFLDHFIEGHCSARCHTCNHCADIARHTVTLDDQWRCRSLALFDQAEHLLTDGGLWK